MTSVLLEAKSVTNRKAGCSCMHATTFVKPSGDAVNMAAIPKLTSSSALTYKHLATYHAVYSLEWLFTNLLDVLQPVWTVPAGKFGMDRLKQSTLQVALQRTACQTVRRILLPKALVLLKEHEAKLAVMALLQAVQEAFDQVRQLKHLHAMTGISAQAGQGI